jgi:hypothetical protein
MALRQSLLCTPPVLGERVLVLGKQKARALIDIEKSDVCAAYLLRDNYQKSTGHERREGKCVCAQASARALAR